MTITAHPAWQALEAHHRVIRDRHLRELFAEDPKRGERMQAKAAGIYLDYSKNRITEETLRLLLDLAAAVDLRGRSRDFRGDKINVSEKRAVLHVALRAPRDATTLVDGENVVPALHAALDRVYKLGVSLPDAPLARFRAQTAALPQTTEAERLVVQRIGQDIFRAALMDYWGGRCPLTGITDPALLRASHIVPWAECDDAQRLDVHNGLLLSALWDAAFDSGLVSFADDGTALASPELSARRADRAWHRDRTATDQSAGSPSRQLSRAPRSARSSRSAGVSQIEFLCVIRAMGSR